MIQIRNAKLRDVKAIAKLNLELMKHVGQYDPIFKLQKKPLPIMEEWRRKGVYSSRQKLMVAECDGKIIGYINATTKTRPKIYEVKEVGFISDLYVLPEYRKQNIGKKLVEPILEWLKQKGVRHVHLYAVSKNEVALTVWKKFKFKEFLREKYREI
ncbi:GNAT family N-acetyltransferase [Candidatus Pacearchaeota archaeon]|nr:GNAT family N-acetyltransferase [Candidatus Pacearchaeota archaeon]